VALLFYIPVGFALGILAALRKDTLVDNFISVSVMILISLPSFVTMTFLVLVFGYGLGWLPVQFPPADVTGSIRYTAYILPVLGLSFGAVASLTRVSRAELTEVLTSEFLLLARTKGLSRTQAVLRHAMRNSMVPLVPGIIGSFVGLLSGSVIIEVIYSIPGTGRIFIRAMAQNNYDFNLILGITAFYTIISLFAILLVDLSYGLVDPRIRIGAKR
jgi:oligopeptide transport system permease protein